jgi:hypothetical protein
MVLELGRFFSTGPTVAAAVVVWGPRPYNVAEPMTISLAKSLMRLSLYSQRRRIVYCAHPDGG